MHFCEEQHIRQVFITWIVYICLHVHALYFYYLTILCLCCRLKLLEVQLEQLEQFDQMLLTLTQRSESFLSGLRSSSQVDIADLEAAITELKVRNQSFALVCMHFHIVVVTLNKFKLLLLFELI